MNVFSNENGCLDVMSNVITIEVYDDISINTEPLGGSICEGGDFDLSVVASGSPGLHYSWQVLNIKAGR